MLRKLSISAVAFLGVCPADERRWRSSHVRTECSHWAHVTGQQEIHQHAAVRMGSHFLLPPPNEGVSDSATAGQRQRAARGASPISSATDRPTLQPAAQDVGINTAKCLGAERVSSSRLVRFLQRLERGRKGEWGQRSNGASVHLRRRRWWSFWELAVTRCGCVCRQRPALQVRSAANSGTGSGGHL